MCLVVKKNDGFSAIIDIITSFEWRKTISCLECQFFYLFLHAKVKRQKSKV